MFLKFLYLRFGKVRAIATTLFFPTAIKMQFVCSRFMLIINFMDTIIAYYNIQQILKVKFYKEIVASHFVIYGKCKTKNSL